MDYRNILIVKLSSIGDVIHALPVAQALKHRYPLSRITWIVEKPAYDLLTMNPYIDEIMLFDKPKFKSPAGFLKHVPELARRLKSRHFDLTLDLQGLLKSAAIAWLSGARMKLGYCNMRELSGLVSKPVCGHHKEGHVIERYLDVARHLGCRVTEPQSCLNPAEEDIQKANQLLAQNKLAADASYIILAPGTNWPSKCWPAASYAALAEMLWENYKMPCVVVGGSKDQALAEEIKVKTTGHVVDLTGKTNLKQLAHILRQSRLFIGGDTGPMHLAVSVATTVIALFGPSDYQRNGPYGEKHVVIHSGAPCAPCFKRNCPDIRCMREISPSDVFKAVSKVIERQQNCLG